MPAFDLSKLREEEQTAASKMSDGYNYEYPLLYPQQGTTRVKLLYNPASDIFKRQIWRHAIGSGENAEKIPCLRTWEQPCPLCKVLEDIEKLTGKDLGGMKGRGRGISFAQFVEANYATKGIEKGDVVFLMYPWTILKDFNQIASQAKTDEELYSIIASNYGYVIDINRNKDNQYSAKTNPFGKVKTVEHHKEGEDENPEKIAIEEKEFEELLISLPPLAEQTLPLECTEEILEKVQEAALSLERSYISSANEESRSAPSGVHSVSDHFDNISKPSTPAASAPVSNVEPPSNVPSNVPSEPAATDALPTCFGKHGTVASETCTICHEEVKCFNVTKGNV